MEFSRQEYGSGLPYPSPEDLPDPGMEPMSPALQADSTGNDIKMLKILCIKEHMEIQRNAICHIVCYK